MMSMITTIKIQIQKLNEKLTRSHDVNDSYYLFQDIDTYISMDRHIGETIYIVLQDPLLSQSHHEGAHARSHHVDGI